MGKIETLELMRKMGMDVADNISAGKAEEMLTSFLEDNSIKNMELDDGDLEYLDDLGFVFDVKENNTEKRRKEEKKPKMKKIDNIEVIKSLIKKLDISMPKKYTELEANDEIMYTIEEEGIPQYVKLTKKELKYLKDLGFEFPEEGRQKVEENPVKKPKTRKRKKSKK